MLATQLAQRGFDVTIAVFYPKKHLYEGLEDTGVRVVSLDKRGRWDMIGFSRRLLRLIRREEPAIVHSYRTAPNVIAALLKVFYRNRRLIWGVRASFMDMRQFDLISGLSAWIEARLAGIPDLIICNSYSGYHTAAQRGFPVGHMCVINNGIDTRRFVFDARKRNHLRANWGISIESILVGLVARVDPMKDLPTFFKAAELAAAQNPKLRFICVGRGMEGLRLEHATDWLQFIDAVDDTAGIYSALDILCSSSRGEGFSNAIAEAMSCQRPCVVTDVGDSSRIVGETGIVVPAEEPTLLAQAIVSLAESDLPERGRAARNHIVSQFGLERLGIETETALRRLK